MSEKELDKLCRLVIRCELALNTKSQQSINIWRGEMRAVVSAFKVVQRQRARKAEGRS